MPKKYVQGKESDIYVVPPIQLRDAAVATKRILAIEGVTDYSIVTKDCQEYWNIELQPDSNTEGVRIALRRIPNVRIKGEKVRVSTDREGLR